jgi:hypothetical protein
MEGGGRGQTKGRNCGQEERRREEKGIRLRKRAKRETRDS